MGDIVLEKTLAALPETKRGYGYQLYSNAKKGNRLVYCNSKAVYIRDMDDPTSSSMFVGEHKGNCNVAQFSPNGEWVASGDQEGRMLVWGHKNFNIKSDIPVNKDVLDIVWSPDGKRICAVGNGSENMARAVAWDTGSNLGSVGGHTKTILSVDYRTERPFRIVTAGEDMTACFHEGPPFKFGKSIKDHSNYINKIKFCPDGSKFISVSSDRKIIAYEGKTAEKIKEITSDDGHTGSIYSFAWSPDGAKFLTCGADKTAKVWDYETGTVEKTFTFAEKPTVQDMQMCALWHQDQMVTVSLSGAINYLDPENPSKPKKIIVGHLAKVTDIAVKDGTIYSADTLGTICVWKDYTASWFTGKGHGKSIRGIDINHDGTKLASVGLDDKLRINDAAGLSNSDDAIPLGGTPLGVACGKASDVVAVVLAQNKIVLAKGGDTKTHATSSKPLTVAFNHDDTELAVGFEKGVKVYKVDGCDIKEAYEKTDHNRPISKVQFSPDGSLLVTSSQDKRILVNQGDKILNKSEWEFHNGTINDHCISPNGKRVASVASDLTLFVWEDSEKWGTKRRTMKMAHREGIIRVAWLDDDTVLTVGADGAMKVWKCA